MSKEQTRSDQVEDGGRTGSGAAAETVDCDVSLYLRASPTGVGKRRQERVEKRLRALAEEGRIGSLSVEHWPGQMRVGAEEESPVADRYDELAGAAGQVNAGLAPFFDDREGVDGMIQSQAGTRIITFPVIAVVIEQAGGIVGLYPCRRDGIHHRVEDGVDSLASGEVPANLR
jgi:hypothetical protein